MTKGTTKERSLMRSILNEADIPVSFEISPNIKKSFLIINVLNVTEEATRRLKNSCVRLMSDISDYNRRMALTDFGSPTEITYITDHSWVNEVYSRAVLEYTLMGTIYQSYCEGRSVYLLPEFIRKTENILSAFAAEKVPINLNENHLKESHPKLAEMIAYAKLFHPMPYDSLE